MLLFTLNATSQTHNQLKSDGFCKEQAEMSQAAPFCCLGTISFPSELPDRTPQGKYRLWFLSVLSVTQQSMLSPTLSPCTSWFFPEYGIYKQKLKLDIQTWKITWNKECYSLANNPMNKAKPVTMAKIPNLIYKNMRAMFIIRGSLTRSMVSP